MAELENDSDRRWHERVAHLSPKEAARIINSLQTHSARPARLELVFPELTEQLNAIAGIVGEDLIKIASQHALCAEALIEVAKQFQEQSSQATPTLQALHDAFAESACRKLETFGERPARERERITDAYPDLNLQLVRIALDRGLTSRSFAADALTDFSEYAALVRLLEEGDLLPPGRNHLNPP